MMGMKETNVKNIATNELIMVLLTPSWRVLHFSLCAVLTVSHNTKQRSTITFATILCTEDENSASDQVEAENS